MNWCIPRYFRMAFTNKRVLQQRGDMVLTLRSHEIIKRPRETPQKLCDHLMVTCYQEYVESCEKILHQKLSVTRNAVTWTDDQKKMILREMQKYPYLKDYNFEDVP